MNSRKCRKIVKMDKTPDKLTDIFNFPNFNRISLQFVN